MFLDLETIALTLTCYENDIYKVKLLLADTRCNNHLKSTGNGITYNV